MAGSCTSICQATYDIDFPTFPFPHHPSLDKSQVNQIKHRLILNTLPNLPNSPRRLLTNRPLPNSSKRLLQLLQRRRPNNNRISILSLERTIILHPAVRKIRPRRAFLLRDCSPFFEGFKEAGLVEALVVGFAVRGGWIEAAFARGDIGGGFGEEAAGERRVGVEALVDELVYMLGCSCL